jgi:pyruvate dehydrogenase E1 component alpha subunit
LRSLPVLFICENNYYSVYSPLGVRQPQNRKIHEVARSLGVSACDGDGNDVIAAYLLINDAAEAVRMGKGPQLLEFYTYRTREHCGPNYDDDLGYRDPTEVRRWFEKDPVENMKSLLIKNRLISQGELEKEKHRIVAEIQNAFLMAEQSPFPAGREVDTYVYSN